MRESILLRASARLIVPLKLLFSVFLMLRGHNDPGGGFIGGLVAASGIVLHGIAWGVPAARRLMLVSPQKFIATGLLASLTSGIIGIVAGHPFLTGLWGGAVPTLIIGKLKLGTPLLFDIGVYLVVIGVGVLMIFTMAEEEQ